MDPLKFGLMSLLALGTAGCRDDADGDTPNDASSSDAGGEGDDDDDTGEGEGDESAGTEVPDYELLAPGAHLVRVSMALRGKRPSVADLDLVEEDPDVLAEVVDRYLDSEEFGEVIRDLHNDTLLVDAEIFEMEAVGPLADESPSAIAESVLQGPLRLIEHVVLDDAPYTEIVTADYWVVDQRSSEVWGTDYDSDGETWQAVDVPDDRPAGGILTDNGIYMRHESCGFNFNRGRAQLVTNALLCHDFLAADIDIDGSIDLSDPDAVATAVENVGACMGCHQTLDPLASAMNPFLDTFVPDPPYSYPLPPTYLEELEDAWPEVTGRAPGLFGKPVDDLGELGQSIADDPRFSLCAAMRFYSYFAQVPLADVPLEVAGELQLVLEDNDFSAKQLVRHIMLSDEFRRSAATEDGTANPDEVIGYKRARPFQVANLIEDLTGYEWLLNLSLLSDEEPDVDISLARSAFIGFEVLAGGHDSFFQTTATTTANATTVLFMRALAQRAASYVVDTDFAADADDRRLLRLVDSNDTDESDVRAQIVDLCRRLYGESVQADDPTVDDAYAIYTAVHDRSDDSPEAWKATLTAMLSDMDILYY